MTAPLHKRLLVRPGQTILAVDAPRDDAQRLGAPPAGARLVTRGDATPADHAHVLVRAAKDLARVGPKAIAGANGGAVRWIAYPKRTSGVETGLTRARGRRAVTGEIDAVSQVAVDGTWTALRSTPVGEAGHRGYRGRT